MCHMMSVRIPRRVDSLYILSEPAGFHGYSLPSTPIRVCIIL